MNAFFAFAIAVAFGTSPASITLPPARPFAAQTPNATMQDDSVFVGRWVASTNVMCSMHVNRIIGRESNVGNSIVLDLGSDHDAIFVVNGSVRSIDSGDGKLIGQWRVQKLGNGRRLIISINGFRGEEGGQKVFEAREILFDVIHVGAETMVLDDGGIRYTFSRQ